MKEITKENQENENKEAEESREWHPTAQQKAIAELLANPEDRRTKKEKYESIKLPERTFYNWMRNNDFIKYVNSLIDGYTDSQLADVWRAHMLEIKRGNMDAIKLYHQLKGNLVERSKVQSEVSGDLKVENVPNYEFYKKLTPAEIKLINESGVYPTSLESARRILEALKK